MATFKTGRVDPTKPMELDDGRPVEFIERTRGIKNSPAVVVRVPGAIERNNDGQDHWNTAWVYRLEDGVWDGGSANEYFVLRNVVAEGTSSLPEDDATRNEYPMFDGLMAYFPNALAEVSRVSKIGNDQHNPGEPMHHARGKSKDHGNKMMRHLADIGKKDARGVRHSARLAWRALANLQEELERDEGYPLPVGAKAA